MNEFTITPFRGLHLLLLLLTAAAALLIFLLLHKKPEARRSRFLIGACLFNLALFAGYKLSLSMDAAYVRAYYPNGFNIFNELPLHLCNINLFLIPLGVWKRNRSIMGFSFFVAPLGALMALLFPEPLFSGFSLFLPRIFGYAWHTSILSGSRRAAITAQSLSESFSQKVGLTARNSYLPPSYSRCSSLECRTHCSTAESFANTCVTPVLRAYVKMQRTAQCIGDCHNSRQGGA